ncbi:GTP-binding protein [Spirulina sp. CS-785/01]|uniref:Rab family GTPase n=1 Tax=Spirulina sp. CS-785/01 TaxID=3021716 RepID=UPI00232E82F6|nr:GTP-binding protein [Spirulina sp. CS-785/01]MDB9315833.1 GTP-binding protein [Spirulina sp. CS-785/01]
MGTTAKKICLVGDFAVGKTSLIRRFVDNQFSDDYLSTVGVKLSRKLVKLTESRSIELLIWDIEGQTQFKSIAPSYLQGAKGAIMVADVKRPETIQNLKNHLDLFFSINQQGWVIVALNKVDLITPEKLDKFLQVEPFSQQSRVLDTYGTSAKTGKDVEEIFYELAEGMMLSE